MTAMPLWTALAALWPELMSAACAARYVGERSTPAFRRRVGTLYPRPIKIAGRGDVWRKTDLDRVIAHLTGSPTGITFSAADVL
jgi:hypothetical protein